MLPKDSLHGVSAKLSVGMQNDANRTVYFAKVISCETSIGEAIKKIHYLTDWDSHVKEVLARDKGLIVFDIDICVDDEKLS